MCDSRIQKSGVRIQNKSENNLFLIAVTKDLGTNAKYAVEAV